MTISHIQGTLQNNGASTGTSLSFSLASAVGNSNAVMFFITYDTSVSSTPPTCKDNQNNTYTIVDSVNDTNDGQAWTNGYLTGITNGPQTLTFTFSESEPANSVQVVIDEYSGIALSSALDGHAMQEQTPASSGTNGVTSPSITTLAAGDLIYAGTVNITSNSPSVTAGTNFTIRESQTGTGFMMASEDWVQPSAGSVAGTFTISASGQNIITGVMAFQAAVAGATYPFQGLLLGLWGELPLTNVSTDATVSFENVASNSADDRLPIELLVNQKNDANIVIESLSVIANDSFWGNNFDSDFDSDFGPGPGGNISFEFNANIPIDSTVLLESLQTSATKLTTDSGLPLEFVGKTDSDIKNTLEMLAHAAADQKLVSEYLARQANDASLPIESRSSAAADSRIPLESLARLGSDQSVPLESLGKSTADTISHAEFLARAAVDGAVPLEKLSGTPSDATVPLEELGHIAADQNAPLESLGAQFFGVSGDAEVPFEFYGNLRSDTGWPLENLFAFRCDSPILFELRCGIRGDLASPVENLTRAVSNLAMSPEALARVPTDSPLPTESLGAQIYGVSGDSGVPLEFVVGQRADIAGLLEALTRIAADNGVQIEYLARIGTDSHGPFEFSGAVAAINLASPAEFCHGVAADVTVLAEWLAHQPIDLIAQLELVRRIVADIAPRLEDLTGAAIDVASQTEMLANLATDTQIPIEFLGHIISGIISDSNLPFEIGFRLVQIVLMENDAIAAPTMLGDTIMQPDTDADAISQPEGAGDQIASPDMDNDVITQPTMDDDEII